MPIIVLSARTGEADKVKALDLGANDYITKPFGTEELLARVRATLRNSRLIGIGERQVRKTFRIKNMTIAYVVNASNGKKLTVSLPEFTVSGGEVFDTSHKTTVYFFTDGVTGSLAKKEVDATPVYNTGWNDCIAEAKSYGSWSNMCTISENSPGTLYMLVNGVYTSVGSSWVKVNTVSGTFYKLPATK